MDLSGSELIRLFKSAERTANQGRHRLGSSASRQPNYGDGRRRCHCGQCRGCLDNARWERIYNEKFADPNYYAR
jgi:hypothetical protein